MTLYNDNDPKVCAWLRQLITDKHLPAGIVDSRSITDLRAADLAGHSTCHFFAGIGGWPLALRLAGWPDDLPVWTASCPCQPFSVAGKGKGCRDKRHLWPDLQKLIAQCHPAVIFGEQVASKAGRLWLARVRAGLEALDYAVGAADLCAAGIGAPHIRQRLFWVAVSKEQRFPGRYAELPRDCRQTQSHGLPMGGRLADTDGGQSRHRELQPGRQHRQQPQDGGSGRGMDDAQRNGLEPGGNNHAENDRKFSSAADQTGGLANAASMPGAELRIKSGQRENREPQNATERGNARVGLEHPAGDGRVEGRPESSGRGIVARREPGRMGVADTAGCGKQSGAIPMESKFMAAERASRLRFWDAFDLIPCADGKARRIEPGTFPLAHGVSGRVGLLRGYGNAIVPQLAAEFIRAFAETLEPGNSVPVELAAAHAEAILR